MASSRGTGSQVSTHHVVVLEETPDIQTPPSGSKLKYASLVCLMLQNAAAILIMRYVRVRPGDMFLSTTAVTVNEMIKLFTSLTVIYLQQPTVVAFIRHLNENIIQQPLDCVKILVPSAIYIIQNNLIYIALSHLDAATFQVTYQLKILITALLSVIMLEKRLSNLQWSSLILLFLGVSTVQLQPHQVKVTSKVIISKVTPTAAAVEQNPLIGLAAVAICSFLSAFAGVYFEKILKGTKQSIWVRNVQLGCVGSVFSVITMVVNDGSIIYHQGFLYGYDWVVWLAICIQAFGGLLVAVVVKYADNILKGFATSGAIIISCIGSVYIFNFTLSLHFNIGAILVILAMFLYSNKNLRCS